MAIGGYRKRLSQTALKHSIGDIFQLCSELWEVIEITKSNWYRLECISSLQVDCLASDNALQGTYKLCTDQTQTDNKQHRR